MANIVTQDLAAKLLAESPREYKVMHDMNARLLRGAKLGTVFMTQSGDWGVYVGVDGRNRKFPIIYVNTATRRRMKATVHLVDKIAAASAADRKAA